MSIVGSVLRSGVLLEPKGKEPEKALKAQPEEESEDKDKDEDKDTRIKDRVIIKNKVELIRLVKVIILLRFLKKPSELKEFLIKVNIYIEYNLNLFLLKADKVTFVISYLEGLAFDFAETFFDDYRINEKKN